MLIKITEEIIKDARWMPFVNLPDKEEFQEYYEMIENQISLTKILENLKTDQYKSINQHIKDIEIISKNTERTGRTREKRKKKYTQ